MMTKEWKRTMLAAGAAAMFVVPAFAATEVDPNLPEYKPVEGISGTIKTAGSDTMTNMVKGWAAGFKKYYPNVTIEMEDKGSSSAPPALIEGTATFGPMSRAMKSKEIDAFEQKFGYKPVQLGTSIDMLAVYVNKDNPVDGLSLAEVDAIFSKNRKLGYSEDITLWGQIDQPALQQSPWETAPISIYGRNSASGTYGYFKKNVLGKGDYKDSVKEQPGSSSVVQGVASDKFGIGYSGIGYKTADVKAIALAPNQGETPVPAEAEYAYNGEYPLSRFLYLSVNYKPGSQLPPLQREFVKYIFSQQGQTDVVKDGYLPVTAPVAKEQLETVGIEME